MAGWFGAKIRSAMWSPAGHTRYLWCLCLKFHRQAGGTGPELAESISSTTSAVVGKQAVDHAELKRQPHSKRQSKTRLEIKEENRQQHDNGGGRGGRCTQFHNFEEYVILMLVRRVIPFLPSSNTQFRYDQTCPFSNGIVDLASLATATGGQT